jgi:hypothetical protein
VKIEEILDSSDGALESTSAYNLATQLQRCCRRPCPGPGLAVDRDCSAGVLRKIAVTDAAQICRNLVQDGWLALLVRCPTENLKAPQGGAVVFLSCPCLPPSRPPGLLLSRFPSDEAELGELPPWASNTAGTSRPPPCGVSGTAAPVPHLQGPRAVCMCQAPPGGGEWGLFMLSVPPLWACATGPLLRRRELWLPRSCALPGAVCR